MKHLEIISLENLWGLHNIMSELLIFKTRLLHAMKRKILRIGIPSLSFIIIILMIWAPGLIKNYVVKNSPELLGRQIALGKLKYNYFTSTLKAYNFKLFEANGQDEFISFDTLILNLEPIKYFQDVKAIEQFYIKGLTSRVIMKDSTFNFDDLIEFHSKEDSVSVEAPLEKDAFKYAISNIEFRESNFYFDNRNVDKLTQIQNLDLAVPFIGWDQEEKTSADVKFNFKNGGFFQSTVNVNPNGGNYDAIVVINRLNLDPFYKYVQEYADINSFNGSLDANLLIEGNTYEGIKSLVSGKVEVSDFEMTDLNNKKFLGAETIICELDTIDYYNSNYQIGRLEARESYTFFQLDTMSNNFFRIFKLDEISDPSDAESAVNEPNDTTSVTLSYGIANLVLTNGILDYTDNLTGQPFNYHLSAIKIDSKDITNSVDWLTINSTMLLNNRGNLVAEVGLNPNDYYHNINFDISIEKFLLPDLNIYTNYYMGHSILEGDMYYYSKSKITNGLINSQNSLLVKNAELETVDAGLYSLPLKFAFFLLTDKNGDVNLEIPVQGDVNDPAVDVGTIVWNTFKNVIGKTVAAPVNFLVGLVGGDPKELEELTLSYTDTIPSSKQYSQLDKLLDLEQKKEELAITMTYYVDANLQKEALAKELVGQDFNNKRRNYLKDEAKFKDYVYKKVKTDSLSFNKALLELTKEVNLDSLCTVKNRRLLEHIDTYLKLERPDTNILITMGELDAPENVGSYPKFMITYGMVDGQVNSVSSDNSISD